MLKSWLAHPFTRHLPLHDPRTTLLRREIIQEKSFLNRIYREWYSSMISQLPAVDLPVLEIGTGGGFLQDFLPDLITSDIISLPWLSIVLDGHHLPFMDDAFNAVVMSNTLHHLVDVRDFLREAGRCVRRNGVVIMIEPWVTRWSSFIFSKFHYEPFEPESMQWDLPRSDLLTPANNALPWIVFARDRQRFQQTFPHWRIKLIREIMPLRYILSGGVSLRSLMPTWSFRFWRAVEYFLQPWRRSLGMFALIVLERE